MPYIEEGSPSRVPAETRVSHLLRVELNRCSAMLQTLGTVHVLRESEEFSQSQSDVLARLTSTCHLELWQIDHTARHSVVVCELVKEQTYRQSHTFRR
jgi:hypothetical protein